MSPRHTRRLLKHVSTRANASKKGCDLASLKVYVMLERVQKQLRVRGWDLRLNNMYKCPQDRTGSKKKKKKNQRRGLLISDSLCCGLNSVKDIEVNGLPTFSSAM